MTYMVLLNCALKLVKEIILYYDARSKKHQTNFMKFAINMPPEIIPIFSLRRIENDYTCV